MEFQSCELFQVEFWLNGRRSRRARGVLCGVIAVECSNLFRSDLISTMQTRGNISTEHIHYNISRPRYVKLCTIYLWVCNNYRQYYIYIHSYTWTIHICIYTVPVPTDRFKKIAMESRNDTMCMYKYPVKYLNWQRLYILSFLFNPHDSKDLKRFLTKTITDILFLVMKI